MSTSRVPGVTRNSGWRAVQVEIVEARGVREQQGVAVSAPAQPQVVTVVGSAKHEGRSASSVGHA